jgi:hypothetical protein
MAALDMYETSPSRPSLCPVRRGHTPRQCRADGQSLLPSQPKDVLVRFLFGVLVGLCVKRFRAYVRARIDRQVTLAYGRGYARGFAYGREQFEVKT